VIEDYVPFTATAEAHWSMAGAEMPEEGARAARL
jgi:hypothetical protein